MIPITDPNQIAQLESNSQGSPITDPAIIAQLEGNSPQSGWQQFQQNPWPMIGNAAYNAASDAGGVIGKNLFNTVNFIPGAINSAFGTNIPELNPNVFQLSNTPEGKYFGQPLGELASWVGPSKVAEGLNGAAQVGSEALPWLQQTARNIAGGSLFGASTAPDGQRGTAAFIGGAIPAATDLAVGGALPATNFAKNLINGTVSPEAQAMNQTVGNLPVPYAAQGIYNRVLNKIPLSGIPKQQLQVNQAAQAQQDAANQAAQNHATSLIEGLKNNAPDTEIANNIAQKVSDNHDVAKTANDALYQKVSDDADAAGLNVTQTPNLARVANQYLNNSNYAIPDNIKGILNKYAGKSTPTTYSVDPLTGENYISEAGNYEPFTPGSFNEAHNLQKTLAGQARSSYGNDNYLGSMYSDLSDAMRDDMEGAAKDADQPDIYNNLLAAKQDFQQNVAPYRDRSVYPIVSGTKNLNTIQNTLTQNTPNINKVVSDLPQQQQQQLAYLKLRPGAVTESPDTGTQTVNQNRLWNNYSRLDPILKQNLLNSNDRSGFSQLGSMVTNPYTPLQKYVTPGINQNNHPYTTGLIEAALTGGSLFHGGLQPAIYSALTSGLTSGAAKLAGKVLTNPTLRNAYLSTPNVANDPLAKSLSNILTGAGMSTALGGQQ